MVGIQKIIVAFAYIACTKNIVTVWVVIVVLRTCFFDATVTVCRTVFTNAIAVTVEITTAFTTRFFGRTCACVRVVFAVVAGAIVICIANLDARIVDAIL